MLNNPVTSVIIPALNEAESIEHVVNNVLQYPCITEVIIVDNGSTDGTYDIAKKIAQKEGRGNQNMFFMRQNFSFGKK